MAEGEESDVWATQAALGWHFNNSLYTYAACLYQPLPSLSWLSTALSQENLRREPQAGNWVRLCLATHVTFSCENRSYPSLAAVTFPLITLFFSAQGTLLIFWRNQGGGVDPVIGMHLLLNQGNFFFHKTMTKHNHASKRSNLINLKSPMALFVLWSKTLQGLLIQTPPSPPQHSRHSIGRY